MYAGGIDYWIGFFKQLESSGKYNVDDDYERRCCIFVFGDMIELTLDRVFNDWNGHKMRKSSKNPGGVPDFLYSHPELYGASPCGRPVPNLFEAYCHAAFPSSQIDLDDLFGCAADRGTFVPVLTLRGLFPITQENMLTAFFHLLELREFLCPMLPDAAQCLAINED